MRQKLLSAFFYATLVTSHSKPAQAQATVPLDQQLTTLDALPENTKFSKTSEGLVVAIDACIAPIKRTEFDTIETYLQHARSGPCQFVGITTLRGKDDKLNGSLLSYDPEHEFIRLSVPLMRLQNLVHGLEAATPYDVDFHKAEAKNLTPDQKRIVKTAGKADYLLFTGASIDDRARTYEASNAFGAKAAIAEFRSTSYDIAINIGDHPPFDSKPMEFTSFHMEREIAAKEMGYLDIKLYWIATPPCDLCFPGGSVMRGAFPPPSLARPYDIQILHRFVFAKLVGIRIVDRRDGKILSSFSGAK